MANVWFAPLRGCFRFLVSRVLMPSFAGALLATGIAGAAELGDARLLAADAERRHQYPRHQKTETTAQRREPDVCHLGNSPLSVQRRL